MKVAVIGSRNLTIENFEKYLPPDTTELVSGGAKGIDACARTYACERGLPITEFLPEYEKYGKNAPLKRNLQIIAYADCILAFWDGASHGTKFVIENGRRQGKTVIVHVMKFMP